jgi:PhnB protein
MRIPPGFNTVTPYFFVQGADRFIEFLVRGLGGVEVTRHMNGDRIANAQVRLGTSTVMVSEASTAFPAMSSSYYFTSVRRTLPNFCKKPVTTRVTGRFYLVPI